MKILLVPWALLLFGVSQNSGHYIRGAEDDNPTYKVQDDSSGITIVNPKPDNPTLREILYYHIIERPRPTHDEPASTERSFTNGHSGSPFWDLSPLLAEYDEQGHEDDEDDGSYKPQLDDEHEESEDQDTENHEEEPELTTTQKPLTDQDVKEAYKARHYLFDQMRQRYAVKRMAVPDSLTRRKRQAEMESVPAAPSLPDKETYMQPGTYGMNLNSDRGYVWNNLNKPPTYYEVGSPNGSPDEGSYGSTSQENMPPPSENAYIPPAEPTDSGSSEDIYVVNNRPDAQIEGEENPGYQTPELSYGNPEPINENPELINDNPVPVSEYPKTLNENPAPINEYQGPINENPELINDNPAPVNEYPETLNANPAPINEYQQPMNENPELINDTPAPVNEYPRPINENPAPVNEYQQPINENPELINDNPAPVNEYPEPINENSAPVNEYQPPINENPELINENPAPVNENPQPNNYNPEPTDIGANYPVEPIIGGDDSKDKSDEFANPIGPEVYGKPEPTPQENQEPNVPQASEAPHEETSEGNVGESNENPGYGDGQTKLQPEGSNEESSGENNKEMPPAPTLPPLNYDNLPYLPDYIRDAISSTDKPASYEQTDNPYANPQPSTENKQLMEDHMEGIFATMRPVEDIPKTYGMNLTSDGGHVWNDMVNPPVSYDVGSPSQSEEEHKEEPTQRPEPDQPENPLPEPAEPEEPIANPEEPLQEPETHEEANPTESLEPEESDEPSIPEDNKPIEEPGAAVEPLQPEPAEPGNPELVPEPDNEEPSIENPEEVSQPGHEEPANPEVLPEPGNEEIENPGAPQPGDEEIEQPSEEPEIPEDEIEKPDIMSELLKSEAFWKWLGEWTATYMELLEKHIRKIAIQEICNREKSGDQMCLLEDKPEDTGVIIKDGKIIVDGREIDLTRRDNLDKDLKRGHQYNKGDDKKNKNENKIEASTIYGNSVGNEKVTNVFIFTADKADEVIETLKPGNESEIDFVIDDRIKENEDETNKEISTEVTDIEESNLGGDNEESNATEANNKEVIEESTEIENNKEDLNKNESNEDEPKEEVNNEEAISEESTSTESEASKEYLSNEEGNKNESNAEANIEVTKDLNGEESDKDSENKDESTSGDIGESEHVIDESKLEPSESESK